jgi:hypothetical protein
VIFERILNVEFGCGHSEIAQSVPSEQTINELRDKLVRRKEAQVSWIYVFAGSKKPRGR